MSTENSIQGEAQIITKVDLGFPYPRYIRLKGFLICVAEGETPEISQANAERIVHTWNCHDDLVEALQSIISDWDGSGKSEKEELKHYDNPKTGKGSYWSPAGKMIKSEFIAEARKVLSKAIGQTT